jgi:hypothetical protein
VTSRQRLLATEQPRLKARAAEKRVDAPDVVQRAAHFASEPWFGQPLGDIRWARSISQTMKNRQANETHDRGF